MTVASREPDVSTGQPERRWKLIAVRPVSDEMRQFKKRTLFLRDRRPELTSKYPDRLVALSSNGTLIAADTVQGILAKVADKGLSTRGLAVKRMYTKPRRTIL